MKRIVFRMQGAGSRGQQTLNAKRFSQILCVGLVFLIPFFLRLLFIDIPLERDEGGYAYGAWRILEGETLYRDITDFSPPGVFYLYAIAIKLFGFLAQDIRLFGCFYMEAVLLCFFLFTRELFDNRTACVATFLLGLISIEPSILGFTSNKESFLLLPIALAPYVLLKAYKQNRPLLFFVCGLVGGAGFLIKQVFLFFMIALGLYILFCDFVNKNNRNFFLNILFYSLGVVSIILTVAGWFYVTDAFSFFYYWVFQHPVEFGGASLDTSQIIPLLQERLLNIGKSDGLLWIGVLFAFCAHCKKRSREGWLLFGIGFSLLLAVVIGFRFRPHYFILITPVVSLVAAWSLAYLYTSLQKKQGQYIAAGVTFYLALVASSMYLFTNGSYFFSYGSVTTSRILFGANPFPESVPIASYVKEHSKPNDSVFIVGSEAQINFYAQRKSPSRHPFFYPLTASYGNRRKLQDELLVAIQQDSPLYILWFDIRSSLFASEPSEDRFFFQQIQNIIKTEYELDGYVLIGEKISLYQLGEKTIHPRHKDKKVSVYLYRRS